MADRVSLSRDDDGRRTARVVGLSMGLLFSLIFVLQAISMTTHSKEKTPIHALDPAGDGESQCVH